MKSEGEVKLKLDALRVLNVIAYNNGDLVLVKMYESAIHYLKWVLEIG